MTVAAPSVYSKKRCRLYHALNRGNSRQTIFWKPEDYSAFERIPSEALERFIVSLFPFQLMPNHWRLILRPQLTGN